MTLLDTIVSPDAGAPNGRFPDARGSDSRGSDARAPSAGTRAGRATKARAGARLAVAWNAKTFAGTVACLLICLAVAAARWHINGAIVPWDSKNHFYPMFRFLADALAHGTVPLWNPYHFSGYPAIADPQSLIFTPSMMLFALVAPDASMPVFDAVILAHLFVGGVGVLSLARRWRWHPAAGVLTALIFMFGGAASSRLEHTGMIISYIYFPWALWSLQGALARRSLVWGLLTGLMIALMALGRDQVAFLLCIGLLGAVLREALETEAPLLYLRDRLPVLLCAGAITVAFMIVPILLTLQFVHDSNRPSITYGVALGGSLAPINLLTLVAPNVFGSLDRIYDYWGPGTGLIVGNDWTDKTDRTIDYMFIGTVPFVLLLWQGVAGGRLLERGVRVFTILFALALVYAFGRHTPLFSIFFDWVPGVSLYRRPADANFPLNVAFAFGSGYLLQRFVETGLPKAKTIVPRWLALALPAAVLLGAGLVIGEGLAFARRYAHFDASFGQLVLAAGAAGLVVLAFMIVSGRRQRTVLATILVVATAGELLWRNTASALNAEPLSTYSAYSGLYPDEARGLGVLRADIGRRAAAGERPRVELIGVNGSWQNASMVLKLEDTIGYNPLRISDYERAVGPVESAIDIDLRQFPGLFRGYTGRLASMLGLDYLVLDRPLDRLPRHFPRPNADLLFAGNSFYVYRLINQSTPRAVLATHVRAVDSDDLITTQKMPEFDQTHETLIDAKDVASLRQSTLLQDSVAEKTPAPGAGLPPTGQSGKGTGSDAPQAPDVGKVTIASYADNRVALDVEATRASVLVLHDLAYPGWTVRVDGRPAPLLRANMLFRGVEVPPGRHSVEFRFEPLTLANLTNAAASLLRKPK